MDPHEVERVVLLSIKPRYADAIFSGTKTVEFRRSRLADDVGTALVYSTLPVGRIIGSFRIQAVCSGAPDDLWHRYQAHGGIHRNDYFRYFEGAHRAYAIQVAEATLLEQPLNLAALAPGLRPPQSFQYLPAAAVQAIVGPRTAAVARAS